MSLDNLEDSMKIIVVGDGNVGKTTMLRRYVKGVYSEQYKKTIGADYLEKDIYLKDLKQNVTMMLWDTAGQEVFNALTASYYRNAAACVLAFSTIDRDSFQNILSWKKKVEAQCGSIVMVLCQTKYDLANTAAMTQQEADGLATHLNIPFFRISTKEDSNVSALFEFVARQCVLKNEGGGGGAAPVTSTHGPASSSPSPVVGGHGGSRGDESSGAAAADGKKGGKNEDAGGTEDKKDKKDKKDKDKGGVEKDGNGNNVKPIQMKEIKKKDKKEKKKGFCVV